MNTAEALIAERDKAMFTGTEKLVSVQDKQLLQQLLGVCNSGLVLCRQSARLTEDYHLKHRIAGLTVMHTMLLCRLGLLLRGLRQTEIRWPRRYYRLPAVAVGSQSLLCCLTEHLQCLLQLFKHAMQCLGNRRLLYPLSAMAAEVQMAYDRLLPLRKLPAISYVSQVCH